MNRYVKRLIKNSEAIRASAESSGNFSENVVYNDLLLLEKAIDDLYNNGIITDYEYMAYDSAKRGEKYSRRDFGSLCSKISFLYPQFSDDYVKHEYSGGTND